jgi:Ca-activated chloride channel family protein
MAVLLEKLERPVATDLELEWDDPAAESYPPRPPDLYAGEPILVVARLDRPDAGVRLRGRREGQAFEQAFAPAAPRPSAGLAKLWARRKIDALEASTREPGAPLEAIRAEIVALALAHSLLSRHTSFVAVEELPSAGGPPEARRDVGALRPAGWTLGGELPQGGTEAARLLLAAIGAGVAGLLLHRIGRREREP